MKVDAPESPSDAAKQSPDGERFKKALQEEDARRGTDARPPPRTARAPASEPAPSPRPGVASARSPGLPGGRAPAPVQARASGPVLATSRGALASAESLGRTRQAMHSEAWRLGTVRGEANTQVQERTEHRLTDLIARELSRDSRPAAASVPEARPASSSPATDPGRGAADAPPPESRVTGAGATGSGGASSAETVSPATRAEAALELIERIEVFVKSQRPALSLSLRGALDATVEVERTGPREVALRIQGRRGPLPTEDLARLRDALEARGLRLRSLRAE
ncbi:hypothetical protein [Pyxidicoccus sp. MSG2]|uniref:hypothetical protein n=1 Tax=Pyxidicoccus sp. MSG2 TaxID=2996790 RepID=UPI00226D4E8B|nr:hypothetical protein [Pyxidicoccus sp. MSG2]MCY1014769.1 hypothetical protein [Pyxidicoccus sp. MSG2]